MENEQVYRREGLTIRSLAAQLDIPEYRLRRVINQQLGYRNFNTFVNHFRIEEACRILADPAHERLPILNLALDLGFGSLGPFNRAFRARIGQTPTEYRRARLAGPPRTIAEDRNHSPNVKIATKL
jgi:AraC-like DNA-binding protein